MLIKYANRRVYDTGTSGYTTTRSIRTQLLAGERVYKHLSEEDVTAQYLVEMIRQDVDTGTGPSVEVLLAFVKSYAR